MRIHIRKARPHPALKDIESARMQRRAGRIRDQVQPEVLALAEQAAKFDQQRSVDHHDQPHQVVLVDKGVGYEAVSPYSENIRWSRQTTNIESGYLNYSPEGELREAVFDLPDRSLAIKSAPEHNLYTLVEHGQTSVVREDLKTGLLTLENPEP